MVDKVIKCNKGFSLVELIIVIAIMAILMGVLAPTLIGNVEKSRESTDLQNLDTIKQSIVTIMSDETVYTEVMGQAIENDPLVIDLGGGGDIDISVITLTKFRDKLEKTIPGDIHMRSSAAQLNHLYIEVDKEGIVTVFVAPEDSDSSQDAISCKKTMESDGTTPLKFISK